MEKYVLIVAGGRGARMESEVPKQFLPLAGRPVLMRTIEAFYSYDPEIKIVVVLPEGEISYWSELCRKYVFGIEHSIAFGGKTRFHSVRNGLSAIVNDDSYTAVHDGVRPLVSSNLISRCFEAAERKGTALPVVPLTDTLRKKGQGVLIRSDFSLAQTPQIFRTSLLKKAYETDYSPAFTDDVSVVESFYGCMVDEVPGERSNIKITTPLDLQIAEALMENKRKQCTI